MTWEDAPSYICRGGDVRGLAFCCPPVKPCPVLNALQEVNLTPKEYIEIKKKMIIVNDGDKFRDKNEILKEALDFVN